MIYTKNYKFSAFGEFDKIQPTPEVFEKLLQQFGGKGFIPSLANELRVSPSDPQKSMAVRRVVLSNTNNENVAILGNRIDYEFQYDQDYILGKTEIEEILTKIRDVYSFLFDNFSVKSNRLAVNIDCYAIPKESDFKSILSKFLTPVDFINSNDYVDYSVRALIRKISAINGSQENFNIISTINLGDFNIAEKDEVKHMNGFVVHSDINTAAENIIYRFSTESISPFIEQAYEWWQDSLKGLY